MTSQVWQSLGPDTLSLGRARATTMQRRPEGRARGQKGRAKERGELQRPRAHPRSPAESGSASANAAEAAVGPQRGPDQRRAPQPARSAAREPDSAAGVRRRPDLQRQPRAGYAVDAAHCSSSAWSTCTPLEPESRWLPRARGEPAPEHRPSPTRAGDGGDRRGRCGSSSSWRSWSPIAKLRGAVSKEALRSRAALLSAGRGSGSAPDGGSPRVAGPASEVSRLGSGRAAVAGLEGAAAAAWRQERVDARGGRGSAATGALSRPGMPPLGCEAWMWRQVPAEPCRGSGPAEAVDDRETLADGEALGGRTATRPPWTGCPPLETPRLGP
mmetsp:Transcript_18259/g.69111  ORF Transcript_18259/g.69111 Transcript_18259/m.69111 type:complete len:328 (-) Transcript_18259:2068-3051(-)